MSDQLEAETQEVSNFDIDGPQSDDINQESESVSAEESSTPAVDSEEQHEEPAPFTPEVQRVIAAKAVEAREAKRRARELEEQLAKAQPQANMPKVGAIPDRWDFDDDDSYQAAINEYAESKAKEALYLSQQEQIQKQQLEAQQARQQEEMKVLQGRVDSYRNNAEELGVDLGQLQVAGNVVADHGLNESIVSGVLDDKDGALVTMYLAANPGSIKALNEASPFELGGVYSEIKSKAQGLKPKTSEAPQPPDISSGGAPTPNDNPRGFVIE